MNIMKNPRRILIACLTLLGMVVLTAPAARAEYPVWAPINPSFIGGNPLMGQFLLNKAQVTNEHDPLTDPDGNPGNPGNPGSNPAPSTPNIGPAMDRFMERIDDILQRTADSIERGLQGGTGSLSAPLNIQLTGGSGNVVGGSFAQP